MKSELTVVSKERHQHLTWQRPTNFEFAARDAVATLVSQEVPRAMANMALAFMESGGAFALVAVQGHRANQNRYVSRDGRWLGDYIPAMYRAHPFKLARGPENAEVLCIDEAAGQVSESSSGEPFFTPDGNPAPLVADTFKLLIDLEKDRQRTAKICELLSGHGLLEPWPLEVQDGDKVVATQGLLRIAESKLYGLAASALAEIRDGGALMLAYAQLFSMQQIHKLGKLGAAVPGNSGGPKVPAVTEENGIISFENL